MDEKEKIKAILDRDSRYDGVFWYGVKSTRIVCKPSCNAKIPLLKNIELFDRVEDAIKNGYRPCKICMKVMKEKNTIKIKRYESLCGVLMLGSFGDKLCLCDWQVEKHRDHVDRRLKRILRAEFEEGTSEVIGKAERQLDEFFAGQRREFDVPLLFVGTDFQKTVWNELLKIPFGQTISYGEMARRIGMPKAVRAVANANGANSMSIFAPCHRVIGSDHSLTGYGGGLDAKRFLLDLEGTNRELMLYENEKMIRLQRIHSVDTDEYRFMERLLTTAFPKEEYRELDEIRRLTEMEPIFHNNLILDGHTLVGFITYWNLNGFCYIEHFAMCPDLRNKGYGKDVLTFLRESIRVPLVLEVELPLDEMTRRRIGFYERQGFILWRHKYTQPPYRQGGASLDLYLMAYGELDEEKDFDTVRKEIYKVVYSCKI